MVQPQLLRELPRLSQWPPAFAWQRFLALQGLPRCMEACLALVGIHSSR